MLLSLLATTAAAFVMKVVKPSEKNDATERIGEITGELLADVFLERQAARR